MDADTLARCTEAFFTAKPKEEASGLGEGATFTLVLPVADAAASSAR